MIADITQTTKIRKEYRAGSKPLEVSIVKRYSKSGSEYTTTHFSCDIHNMGTHIDVIEYLVTKKVNMTGIDTLGLGLRRNHGVIDDYLTENKIYGIENLCNLKNIPTKYFKVYCLPIKVEGIYAQPARVLVEF
ncbi:MAG: hypothetical protein E7E21_05305 [Peptostreptococcaceae bacterium]|nr:hypothetical protein [Peptostreptococcaceae bacterium]